MSQIPEEAAERMLGYIHKVGGMCAEGKYAEAEEFFRPLL